MAIAKMSVAELEKFLHEETINQRKSLFFR